MNVRTAFTVSYRALRTAIPRTKAADADTHGQVETRCCERKATEAPMSFVLMSAVKPSESPWSLVCWALLSGRSGEVVCLLKETWPLKKNPDWVPPCIQPPNGVQFGQQEK
jgi:hypothetical protein